MQWDYGFDFGADAVRLVTAGSDEIRIEAAYAAYRFDGTLPFAWGDRAYAFVGRQTPGLELRRPMLAGKPVDLTLMSHWVGRMLSGGPFKRRRVLMTVSPELSSGAADSLLDALTDVDTDQLGLVRSGVVAALGCCSDLDGSRFVMDIGASHMTFSALFDGRCVSTVSSPTGMDRADEAIIEQTRLSENVIISPRTARMLKHFAYSGGENEIFCSVFDPVQRLPREMKLSAEIAQDALSETVSCILDTIRRGIAALTGSMSADLIQSGLILCGGGSQIGGIGRMLREELGIPVTIGEQPKEAAARGLKKMIEQKESCDPLIFRKKDAGVRI